MSIERQWWNPRNRQSNKSKDCQSSTRLGGDSRQHCPNEAKIENESERALGNLHWTTRIYALTNAHTELIVSNLKALTPKKVKGAARKQIKKTDLGAGFLAEKWVRCLTEKNPIRALVAEHFNYSVGEQENIGGYQMVLWHAVGGQDSAAAHSSSPRGSYHCKHTAITMDTANPGMGGAAYLSYLQPVLHPLPAHPLIAHCEWMCFQMQF